ncbi:MAG: flavodoxin family protein, partial [Synergistaceae bacterium]|nr:flavodoxin family protein [Synergistaceae bacterium]
MKIYAINGSPRNNMNTATMLKKFLEGAGSVSTDIKAEIVHLYDLNYKGCRSCFSCQREGDGYSKCAVHDDIYALLRDISASDGVVFGSPIYFHEITAQMRGFLERLIYPYVSFERFGQSNAPKALFSAFIYTMNVREEQMADSNYQEHFTAIENFLQRVFKHKPERVCAFNTYQYENYADFKVSAWDES